MGGRHLIWICGWVADFWSCGNAIPGFWLLSLITTREGRTFRWRSHRAGRGSRRLQWCPCACRLCTTSVCRPSPQPPGRTVYGTVLVTCFLHSSFVTFDRSEKTVNFKVQGDLMLWAYLNENRDQNRSTLGMGSILTPNWKACGTGCLSHKQWA
jgi:hypothetical protein